MISKFVEVTNGPNNWGKFVVARMSDEDYDHISPVADTYLLNAIGFSYHHVWVLDLQTMEGAAFYPNGMASYDLDKHKVWVCPLFEPFLKWLYDNFPKDINDLPDHLDLKDAPFICSTHRRTGEVSYDSKARAASLDKSIAEVFEGPSTADDCGDDEGGDDLDYLSPYGEDDEEESAWGSPLYPVIEDVPEGEGDMLSMIGEGVYEYEDGVVYYDEEDDLVESTLFEVLMDGGITCPEIIPTDSQDGYTLAEATAIVNEWINQNT